MDRHLSALPPRRSHISTSGSRPHQRGRGGSDARADAERPHCAVRGSGREVVNRAARDGDAGGRERGHTHSKSGRERDAVRPISQPSPRQPALKHVADRRNARRGHRGCAEGPGRGAEYQTDI